MLEHRIAASTFVFFVLCLKLPSIHAQEDSPSSYQLAEAAMHAGQLPESERILLQALTITPQDDRARFHLGVVQFFRAVENLGKALYQHGAVSRNANEPFLRIPVPKNPNPSAISHHDFGRILDLFLFELSRAERTLAKVKAPDVVMPLHLAPIRLSFTGNQKETTSVLDILSKLNGRPLGLFAKNKDFLVHFDRGDVAWLRAYCHLLSGLVDAYRAIDGSSGFEQRVSRVFPKIDPAGATNDEEWYRFLPIVDSPRLHRMRMHFIAVCKLNHETWTHIRKESDDNFEWLPRPGQTDQLGLPITEQQIDSWLAMMTQLEGALTGELLIPSNLLIMAHSEHESGQGLNLAKLLDNPPPDLFNLERIQRDGIDRAYLEPEDSKKVVDILVLARTFSLFNGPFGVFSAARMN